ncbi:MAG: prepilin-type N-terminal cleavage/methylation domain-containing protein [Candidatus Falkowbacteria bacterium]|nr:prepilin-type N-terminal cleavage/methylation domain-containing protein [Candidatus Falkowbacteria bacterium]
MAQLRSKGFTLIELLVVIAIIGVLSTMAIIALGNARAKARDSKRVADIKQISTALELYFSDNGTYPTIITPGQSIKSPDGLIIYMGNVPNNPAPRNDGNCPDVNYNYLSSGSNYTIIYCTGNSVGNLLSGGKLMSSNGVRDLGTMDGLVGYWSFDEGAGATTYDSSGNNNNATWYGTSTVRYATGKVGGSAARFNGVNDYAYSAGSQLPASGTITFWVKRAAAIPFSGSPLRLGTLLVNISESAYVVWLNSSYSPSFQGLLTTSGDSWHFMVVRYRTNEAEFFYDMQSQGLITDTDQTPSGAGIYIGTYVPSVWPMNGLIDDLRVYNRMLSNSEIQTIYDATK